MIWNIANDLKHSLALTFSNIIDGKSQELTSYLSSITEREDLFERFNHELSNEDYADEVAKSFTIAQFNHKEAFVDEIQSKIKDLILSSTTLNSYLNCPRDFLYSHILQIPVLEGDGEQKNYGSAVHKTLEWAIKEANCHYKAPQLNLTAQFYP
ncbi:MAG TPA: PD-(D/E)XK nuclease family protein [Candidatus Gastranaerophilaceae bacterium]|nr:PD-(D/E)XK nuclease family protein [Candidatus Gastranaerophilaceae bacterium]